MEAGKEKPLIQRGGGRFKMNYVRNKGGRGEVGQNKKKESDKKNFRREFGCWEGTESEHILQKT